MDSTTNNGMCRCCASEGTYKDVISKYSWMGDEEIYSDMLKQCFDIDLCVSSDGDNGGICEVCITQLRNAANFKKQVLNTEEQFKKHLQEKLYKSNIVKVEVHKSEDIESDNNASDDYSAPEFEVPIKEEINEVAKPKKRAAAAKATSSSAAKKPKTEIGETSTKRARSKIEDDKTSNITKRIIFTAGIKKEDSKLLSRDKITKQPNKADNTLIIKKIPIKLIQLGVDKHRTNCLEILLNTNATPIRSHGDMGYRCCYCSESYQKPDDLKIHCLTSHDDAAKRNYLKDMKMDNFLIKMDITELKCNLCSTNIDTLEELMDHLKGHGKKIYEDINNLVLPFKFNSEMLKCFMCSNVFQKMRSLQAHMGVHYRNYVCEICDAGFVTKSSKRTHVRMHKTGKFECDQCDKVFNNISSKVSHVKLKHSDILPNKCGYCNDRFKDIFQKRKHLTEVHGISGPANICQACGKRFNSRDKLLHHVKRYHLMMKKHKCEHCPKEFYQKKELICHLSKHTGVKNFKCQYCSKLYSSQKARRAHMKHAHEIQFHCGDCGEYFDQENDLDKHMLLNHL